MNPVILAGVLTVPSLLVAVYALYCLKSNKDVDPTEWGWEILHDAVTTVVGETVYYQNLWVLYYSPNKEWTVRSTIDETKFITTSFMDEEFMEQAKTFIEDDNRRSLQDREDSILAHGAGIS